MNLARIVQLVDFSLIPEINVTLQIGGLVISGDVISAREYTSALLELIGTHLAKEAIETGAVAPENAELYEQHFLNEMTEGGIMDLPDNPAILPLPQFIHLKNVEFIVPYAGNFPPSEFPYWRYTLTAVDGWTLGRVNPE